jgi:serine/threonine protein phosphatase 1
MTPREVAAILRLVYRQTEDGRGWAIFSRDADPGTHRYALGRIWAEPVQRVLVVCGLNPSKATEATPDNTITRICTWGRRDSYDAFVMLNAFALRSTDPHGLLESPDPLGSANDAVMQWALRLQEVEVTAVAAWGKPKWKLLEHRLRTVEHMHPWKCFALTKDQKYPRHPLYLPNSTEICHWKDRR